MDSGLQLWLKSSKTRQLAGGRDGQIWRWTRVAGHSPLFCFELWTRVAGPIKKNIWTRVAGHGYSFGFEQWIRVV